MHAQNGKTWVLSSLTNMLCSKWTAALGIVGKGSFENIMEVFHFLKTLNERWPDDFYSSFLDE